MQTGRSDLYQDCSQRRQRKAVDSGCVLKGSAEALVSMTGAGEKDSSCLGLSFQWNDGASVRYRELRGTQASSLDMLAVTCSFPSKERCEWRVGHASPEFRGKVMVTDAKMRITDAQMAELLPFPAPLHADPSFLFPPLFSPLLPPRFIPIFPILVSAVQFPHPQSSPPDLKPQTFVVLGTRGPAL